MDWTLTIVALLLSPEPVEPVQFADPQTIAALVRVGTVLELVGEGQAWAPAFSNECEWCRLRLIEVGDAPPLREVLRFPGRAIAVANIAFAYEFYAWLDLQQITYPHRYDDLQTLKTETTRAVAPWMALDKASDPQRFPCYRRVGLAELRDALGPELWYAGRMPSHIPIERFQRVR